MQLVFGLQSCRVARRLSVRKGESATWVQYRTEVVCGHSIQCTWKRHESIFPNRTGQRLFPLAHVFRYMGNCSLSGPRVHFIVKKVSPRKTSITHVHLLAYVDIYTPKFTYWHTKTYIQARSLIVIRRHTYTQDHLFTYVDIHTRTFTY